VANISPNESDIYCFMNIVLAVLITLKYEYLTCVTLCKELLKNCVFQFCPAFADEIFTSLFIRFTLDRPVIKIFLLSLQH
jgi:hypothetical protein